MGTDGSDLNSSTEPTGTPDPNQRQETFDRAYVEQLRRENANLRVRSKGREDLEKTNRDLRMQNHLLKAGVPDPDWAEFQLRKRNLWDDLDPSKDDFAETLADRVADIDPLPVQHSGASRSGADQRGPGHQNQNSQLTRPDLKGMRDEDIVEAYRRGNLDALLGRR